MSESSIFKKCAYDTNFSDEFLDFSETTVSFSSLDTLRDAPWSILWTFNVRNTCASLLADEGSTSLRSNGTHWRLSDKETVNAGRKYCASSICLSVCLSVINVYLFDRNFNVSTPDTVESNVGWSICLSVCRRAIYDCISICLSVWLKLQCYYNRHSRVQCILIYLSICVSECNIFLSVYLFDWNFSASTPDTVESNVCSSVCLSVCRSEINVYISIRLSV